VNLICLLANDVDGSLAAFCFDAKLVLNAQVEQPPEEQVLQVLDLLVLNTSKERTNLYIVQAKLRPMMRYAVISCIIILK